jgi:hypothetical protein
MRRHHALGLVFGVLLLLVAGCEQQSIAEQEQIRSRQTLEASTPSVTPTPTITPTNTPTPTYTPTIGPSPTPSVTPTPTLTPVPTPSPLPPTATPNPALAAFSLCTQTAGDLAGGRFSARITGITATVESAFERLTIGLDVPGESAPPYATASCLAAADDAAGTATSGYVLLLNLDGWLHDDAFNASPLSQTLALSGTTVMKRLGYRFDPNAAVGATLAIDLAQPLPFRISLAERPARLVLEVAKTTPLGPSNDMLSLPGGSAQPDTPIYYLQDGDVWRYTSGKATNLTDSPEAETALAFSPAADLVAFCRAAPGAAPDDLRAPSTLWTIKSDGSEPVEVAAVGRACATPTFSPDGQTIAFAVDESGATPAHSAIWIVPSESGDPQRLTPEGDEWSRLAPQWLAGNRLVYAAEAEDGRSTLFLYRPEGLEEDIGAGLVLGDRYRALGRPLAAPDGSMVAIEGLRATKDGADLVLLNTDGKEVAMIGDGYWTRALAWGADGTLFSITTACPSAVAQSYAIFARPKSGDSRLIASGDTLGGFGSFSASGSGLAYVTLAHAPASPRGPLAIDRASDSALWFWDVGGGGRARLIEAPNAIDGLAP